jgi:hypothetical protein
MIIVFDDEQNKDGGVTTLWQSCWKYFWQPEILVDGIWLMVDGLLLRIRT